MKAKKLLAALLSVLIVLMMLPTAAFAEGENEPVTPPETLIVGGTTVVEGNTIKTTTGDNWSYNHSTATLTLNGATINGVSDQNYGAGIYSKDGTLTINFEGENTVTGAGGTYSAAIYADGSGNLVFSGSGTLEAKGGIANYGSYGILSNRVSVLGGNVTASGGTFDSIGENSYGLFSGFVSVNGGTLCAKAGKATVSSFGIHSGGVSVGFIDQTDSTGLLIAESGEAGSYSCAVYTLSEVTVSRGFLYATGGTANEGCFGISADKVIVSDKGVVKAIGGADGSSNYGIYTVNDVSVKGGTVIAKCKEKADNNYGIGTYSGSVYVIPNGEQGSILISDSVMLLNPPTKIDFDNFNQADDTLIFLENKGMVKGKVVIMHDITIPMGGLVTIPTGASLTIPDSVTLTSDGMVESWGTVNGTITGNFIQHPTGVTLNKNTLSLDEGATETLIATVLPENATNKDVTWSSDNPAVATVENGKVTAVKEGQATITVTTEDGGKTATCTVTVNKPAPVEYTITFDPNGGYVSYTSATTSGGKLAALPYAYRYGYTFTGWYTVNGYRVSTDMVFTGNTTLYAGWVYNSVVVPEQPVTPVQPVQPEEPEYEWISEDGGTRLYYDGEMITGWYQDEETEVWYWLDKSSGFMAADQWVKVDGTWYLFGKDGSMLTGWQKVDGKWYYLKPWGGMATGWQLIDSVWYYLRSDGSMAGNAWVQTSGQWYYLTGSGEMATACWIEWKGDWYYLYSSGAMATNATIDGYYVNSNGIWVK